MNQALEFRKIPSQEKLDCGVNPEPLVALKSLARSRSPEKPESPVGKGVNRFIRKFRPDYTRTFAMMKAAEEPDGIHRLVSELSALIASPPTDAPSFPHSAQDGSNRGFRAHCIPVFGWCYDKSGMILLRQWKKLTPHNDLAN